MGQVPADQGGHQITYDNGYLPSFCFITKGERSELEVARSLRLEAGTILAMDRGQNDHEWFQEMTAEVENCAVPETVDVQRDQIITLPALSKAGEEPVLFRRVTYWNKAKSEILVYFTNLLHLAASTIAAIYKDRWQIELFFEALKQNLKVKTFLGTSANAVKTQIWTALIAILILKYLRMKSTYGWSLSNLAALLRQPLSTSQELGRALHHLELCILQAGAGIF